MKRILGLCVALCLVAAVLSMLVPHAHAAEHADHCVCGGSAVGLGDHTDCNPISWKPLSSVANLSKMNFGNLASGNYYLDGNVTVTGWSYVGDFTVSDDKTVVDITQRVDIKLCLNGYQVTSKNKYLRLLRNTDNGR